MAPLWGSGTAGRARGDCILGGMDMSMRSVGIALLSCALLTLSGCHKENLAPVGPSRFVVMPLAQLTLDEGEYQMTNGGIFLPQGSAFRLDVTVRVWPEHYGLEVFVLAGDEVDAFCNGESCAIAWHGTMPTVGTYRFIANGLESRCDYRIVVDNSKAGYQQPDEDNEPDTAIVDIEVSVVE